MVFKLVIEYDGTDFFGWQIQPGVRTVQGEILGAFKKILNIDNLRLIGASRTDRGVHSLGQVASLHTEDKLKMEVGELKDAFNRVLPKDIFIRKLVRANPVFNARFSCKSKHYIYRICTKRSPLLRRYTWEIPYKLDENILKECAKLFIGKRDMKPFSCGPFKKSGEVDIFSASWRKKKDELIFSIEADRFLYRMVRSIVGFMVRIASGKTDISVLKTALQGNLRPRLFIAPPQGLTLLKVRY